MFRNKSEKQNKAMKTTLTFSKLQISGTNLSRDYWEILAEPPSDKIGNSKDSQF